MNKGFKKILYPILISFYLIILLVEWIFYYLKKSSLLWFFLTLSLSLIFGLLYGISKLLNDNEQKRSNDGVKRIKSVEEGIAFLQNYLKVNRNANVGVPTWDHLETVEDNSGKQHTVQFCDFIEDNYGDSFACGVCWSNVNKVLVRQENFESIEMRYRADPDRFNEKMIKLAENLAPQKRVAKDKIKVFHEGKLINLNIEKEKESNEEKTSLGDQ